MQRPLVPADEIERRLSRLQASAARAGLDAVLIFDYIDLFYYTGTIQNGALFMPVAGEPVFFVRRSLERAKLESPLKAVAGYGSFRDVVSAVSGRGLPLARVGIDENNVTLSYFKLLKKNFPESEFPDIGLSLRKIRAVKSAYEIAKMRRAGEVGRQVTALLPSILREGMTEWDLALRLFQETASRGESCLARLQFNSGEFFLGNICFGDSANHPSAFDGPGGIVGKSPACPYGGSDRPLRKGDLIFIDIGYPFQEYYVDKTRVFSFGGRPDPAVADAHRVCLLAQEAVRARLKPGAIPSRIYDEVHESVVVPNGFEEHFMGFGSNRVKFLGHGIGLAINEYPVIAKKFDDPLEENMVLAVEPKKGIAGAGMVGIENTFLVTPQGGENLTADSDEIIVV